MRLSTVLTLAPAARLEADAAGGYATVVFGARAIRLRTPTPGIARALHLLVQGADENQLAQAIGPGDRMAAMQWSRILGALRSGGWLEQTVSDADRTLLRVRSGAPRAGFGAERPTPPITDDRVVTLSRFATGRAEHGVWRVESPRTPLWVEIHDPRVGVLLPTLASPCRVGDVLKLVDPVLGVDEVRSVVRALLVAGLASIDDPRHDDPRHDDPRHDDPDATELAEWMHHDLLFHSRTRMGRHDNPYGGTFRFVGRTEPLPAARPGFAGPVVGLPTPDLERLRVTDPPLSDVVESRASVRVHDDTAPITVDQLAELLFRSQRLRWVHAVAEHGEVASRPYPSGGGLYELEIYPVVSRCAGLEPGLYHYDSAGHRLEQVTPLDAAAGRLAEMARVTCLMDTAPQVVLVVAARFGRVMWKYESVSYSVILKNVGALFQTLYLHATAMGLAPCALGGGDSDLFAEATGLTYEQETSVGEFVLGSRPADWQRRPEPQWSVEK